VPRLRPTTDNIAVFQSNEHLFRSSIDKKAQLMLAYTRDAKTMKKIPPFRSYNKFQSTRKSGIYSN